MRFSLTGRMAWGLVLCGTATSAAFSAVFPHSGFEILSAVSLTCTAALFLMTYQVQRPLRNMAKEMRRAAETEGLIRADENQPGELGELGSAFNWVLARLTSVKADEIDTQRNLIQMQRQLSLQQQLEEANRSLEQRLTDLSLLYDVTRSLSETLPLPELLSRVASLVGQRLAASSVALLLFPEHSDDDALEIKSTWPRREALHGLHIPVGEGPAGRAALRLTPIYVANAGSEKSFYARRRSSDRSILAVPMLHKDLLLGVLQLEREEQDAFDPVEVQMVCAIASQTAVAVQNGRLLEHRITPQAIIRINTR